EAALVVDLQGLGRGLEAFGARRTAIEQPVAIDDLQDSVRAGAVGEVDAAAVRDRLVHAFRRLRLRVRARLLTFESEIADETRARGIREVVDLRHPVRAPALRAPVG